jgi:hypothetical protein
MEPPNCPKIKLAFRIEKSAVKVMKTTLTVLALLLSSAFMAESKPPPDKAPPVKKRTGLVLDLYEMKNPPSNASAYVEAHLTNGGNPVSGAPITFKRASGVTLATGSTNSAGIVRRAVPFNTLLHATTPGATSPFINSGPDPKQPHKD